ncbi:MAG TPA: cell envelope integrity protein TolA [Variovorax sp.]
MSLAADRPEFAPPPQRGTPRAVLLALIAHALLIAALTWGVNWKRESENDAVEAELWSSTVQQAAPRAVAPVPQPPVPTPTPAPPPPPPPPPPPQVVQPPAPPPPKQPDIALEQEKKLQEQKEQQQRELEQQKKLDAAKKAAQDKRDAEAKQRAEDEAERKKEEQQKQADLKKQQQLQQQQADAKAAADAAKKKEADAKQAAQAAADRAATLRRMQALAGSGADDSTGTAAHSSGPSGSYGGRVAAAVRPNVVFPDADLVSGNPGAEFDVRLAPDGTIIGAPTLTKSSGLANWDNAALRALEKTEKLPRDIDGTVPPRLIVTLRPKR